MRSCSEYSVAVLDNGLVIYRGAAEVRSRGWKTWKLDPSALATLSEHLRQAEVFSMGDAFFETSDSETMDELELTAFRGDAVKTIRYLGAALDAPAALSRLHLQIELDSGAGKVMLGKTDGLWNANLLAFALPSSPPRFGSGFIVRDVGTYGGDTHFYEISHAPKTPKKKTPP